MCRHGVRASPLCVCLLYMLLEGPPQGDPGSCILVAVAVKHTATQAPQCGPVLAAAVRHAAAHASPPPPLSPRRLFLATSRDVATQQHVAWRPVTPSAQMNCVALSPPASTRGCRMWAALERERMEMPLNWGRQAAIARGCPRQMQAMHTAPRNGQSRSPQQAKARTPRTAMRTQVKGLYYSPLSGVVASTKWSYGHAFFFEKARFDSILEGVTWWTQGVTGVSQAQGPTGLAHYCFCVYYVSAALAAFIGSLV